MDFSLKLKQETKLILTQEMKTSINILQMSSSKLREYIEKEAVVNPAIEINYSNTSSFKPSNEEYISPLDLISKEETLYDFLEEQINYLYLSKPLKNICIFIIHNLDSRGYLSLSKLEIKNILKISTKQLNDAFNVIYSLEPLGIGAENLKECLKIQLKHKNITDDKLFLLIDNCLEEVANQNFTLVSEMLKISKEKILEYLHLIQTLSPIPARGYHVSGNSNYITPEAKIEIKNNNLIFHINENNIPKVNLSASYINSYDANKSSIYTAINIVKCLEKRYQTLNNILEVLIVKQRDFFFKGSNFLHTLILKDIAKELNLHESTISRAIKDKYLDTPQGIISFKSLFISDSSTIKIKNLLYEFICNENKKKPLSDEKLSLLLKENGFNVARRTITKYREELGYSSTRQRKLK